MQTYDVRTLAPAMATHVRDFVAVKFNFRGKDIRARDNLERTRRPVSLGSGLGDDFAHATGSPHAVDLFLRVVLPRDKH